MHSQDATPADLAAALRPLNQLGHALTAPSWPLWQDVPPRELGHLALALSQQFRNDLLHDLIRQVANLLLGFRLDRVLDQNRLVLRHPQYRAL